MTTTYKVLGQAAPGATTDTNLYTVPASTATVISTVVVANRGSTATSFRVAVRPAGASIANQHYLAFDVAIGANDSTTLTLGITMAATDVLTVQAASANVSFNAFGSEIS
jgi:glucose-6-phosphate dehydrogenase assembly protein OpcA